MSLISLKNSSETEVTVLSNRFIDNFMPRANGEFVKVYIYLLRVVSAAPSSFNLEDMADRLLCTDRDISRALKYWEAEKLISLTYTADQQLSGITLLEPGDAGQLESSVSSEGAFSGGTASAFASAVGTDSVSAASGSATSAQTNANATSRLTPDRVKELKQNEEVSQLLYITEQYLCKTLTPTEIQKILYFYDELKMSADLIEYLVEYCVSRGRKSIRYIETVALAWFSDGVTTVEMAREASSRFSRDYYTILKAMGISGRNPVENEISYIDTWRKTYGFDLELIQEAWATGQSSQQDSQVSSTQIRSCPVGKRKMYILWKISGCWMQSIKNVSLRNPFPTGNSRLNSRRRITASIISIRETMISQSMRNVF